MKQKTQVAARYSFRKGFQNRGKQPAEVVAGALLDIRKHHGELQPAAIVDEAADEGHALHDYFEWDDSEAAKEHRLLQARQLIACVVTLEVGPARLTEPTRLFVSVQETAYEKDAGFENINLVIRNPKARERLLEQARREMEAYQKKYAILEELAEVFKAAKKAFSRVAV